MRKIITTHSAYTQRTGGQQTTEASSSSTIHQNKKKNTSLFLDTPFDSQHNVPLDLWPRGEGRMDAQRNRSPAGHPPLTRRPTDTEYRPSLVSRGMHPGIDEEGRGTFKPNNGLLKINSEDPIVQLIIIIALIKRARQDP